MVTANLQIYWMAFHFVLFVLFATPRSMRDFSSPDQGLNSSPLQWKGRVLRLDCQGSSCF